MPSKRTAIITGSFDPITSGHMDLIRRSSALFDRVYVVILANTEKNTGLFTADERLEMARLALEAENLKNVTAEVYPGLTSDFAEKVHAGYIVRGARSGADFDYEYELSLIMKRFDEKLETVILPASKDTCMISSTYVRDLLKYGCALDGSVPDGCREKMLGIYRSKGGCDDK